MTTPSAAETGAAPSRAAQLLLLRLLLVAPAAKRAPNPASVRKQLDTYLPRPLSVDDFEAARAELSDAGLMEFKSGRLSDRGREEALALLGLDELPPKITWKMLIDRYLFPLAAGVAADAVETRKRLQKAPQLVSYLVQQHYRLPAIPGTFAKTLEALACRELGFPELTDIQAVKAKVLSRLLGADQTLKAKEIEKQLPRVVFNVPGGKPDELRRAIVRRWAAGGAVQTAPRVDAAHAQPTAGADCKFRSHPSEPAPIRAPFDLPAFAAAAARAARESSTGRFGENKVFISHAWRRFREQPGGLPPLDVSAFKQRLIESNRAGLLTLSRADLVSAMDPNDVRESLTHYLNSDFHFILIEGAHP